jgi:hypothetical protein
VDQGHLSGANLGFKWLVEGSLFKEESGQLAKPMKELQEVYRHAAVEENEIFPLAGKLLDPTELSEIGRETMDRRGIKPDKRNLLR